MTINRQINNKKVTVKRKVTPDKKTTIKTTINGQINKEKVTFKRNITSETRNIQLLKKIDC